jgi:hypothetical protein
MELLAEAADAIPRWIETIETLPRITEHLGAIADEYGGKLNASGLAGEPFALTLRITRQFTKALGDQADVLLTLSHEYSASVAALDPAVLSLARIVEHDPERATLDDFRGFVLLVRELAAQARDSTGRLGVLVRALSEARKLSREVRPPIDMLRQGVLRLIDAQAVIDEWERQLASLDERTDIGGHPPATNGR